MKQQKRDWQTVLYDLSTTHTISLVDICKQLKASRSWVSQYILPHLDTIYLNNNIRYGKHTPSSVNWVDVAAIQLNRENMTESVWCNEHDFTQLIQSSVKSFTQQTKKIPIELLVNDKLKYREQYNILNEQVKQLKQIAKTSKKIVDIMKVSKTILLRNTCHYDMLTKTGAIICKKLPDMTKRGDLQRIAISYDDIPEIDTWIAPHDIKDYGETDELIYRNFCKNGYARIELNITTNGKIGRKIYYVQDPHPINHVYLDKYITVTLSDYIQYFQ